MIDGILKQPESPFGCESTFMYVHYTAGTTNRLRVGGRTRKVETQNRSSTREHAQTSRLNVIFQGIDIEDGARICAPNFEVFYQREEINKSRQD